MAAQKPLRAVGPDEVLKPARILSITEAAAKGDQLALLRALRDRVATSVQDPNCPARDLAALTRRLQDISRDIEALEAKAKQEAAEDASAADEAWDATAL
jgi:hypothetical protein